MGAERIKLLGLLNRQGELINLPSEIQRLCCDACPRVCIDAKHATGGLQ